MRWHVHGTDVVTGQPVMLAVEETEATHAVQAALSKRIVVSHVTREGVRRALLPLACAGVVVMGGLCAWLMQRERTLRSEFVAIRAQALLQHADTVMATPALPHLDTDTTNTAAMFSEWKTRLALAEERAATVEKEAEQFKNAQQQAMTSLAAQSHAAQQNGEQASAAAVRADLAEHALNTLTRTNTQLISELDTLKSQLLANAAKPLAEAPAPAASEDTADVPSHAAPLRWALRASYDAASNFVALHFEKDSMQSETLADGTVAWSATSGANAATVRVTHDREKRRVYAALLTVSLAADAPREKLAENLQLVSAFLRAFAPGMKDADARANRLVSQLVNKDSSERCVLVGEDTRVTVWNNGSGVYSWRAESVGNEPD